MGIEAQEILSKTLSWSENFYNMTPEEIMEYHIANNTNRIIYIEYQYHQIGLTNKWLREISAKIGDPLVVRREILLQRLHGSSLSPYSQEDLEYISSMQRNPISALYVNEYYRFDIYEELDKTIPYLVGIDCSTGTNSDNNAITIINPYTLLPVAELQCAYIGETAYEKLIIVLVQKYIPRAILCIERNSVGDGIIDHLLNSPVARNLYYDRNRDLVAQKMSDNEDPMVSMLKKKAEEKKFYGVYTQGTSREQMFTILARHISEYKEKFVTKNIIQDLNGLVRKSSGKIEAGPGMHDDSIMSYLIALYVYYHGNNLEIFGFIKGSDEDIGERNRGTVQLEDSELIPEEVKEAERRSKEDLRKLEYEEILRKAIMKSQRKSIEINQTRLSNVEYLNNTAEEAFIDDDDDSDLSLFDSLNQF